MSQSESEEKSEPASLKKLRDARKKGQISHGRDMVMGATTTVTLIYLWLAWDGITDRLQRFLGQPGDTYGLPFGQAIALLAGEALDLTIDILGPLLVMIVLITLVTNMVVIGGFVFSTEPIKPQLDHVNPVAGFKRIFSLRNLVEFVKSLIKVILMAALIGTVSLLGLDAMVKAPLCGISCVAAVFGVLTKPVVAIAIILLLVSGLLDIGVQRWLFLRDMRMTKTELKRERRDMEGDPQIRSARRREQRALVTGPLIGVRHASVILTDGYDVAIGLRYVPEETPAPVTVCKGRGGRARGILDAAQRQGTPLSNDPELAETLVRRGGLGAPVPQDTFTAVAKALSKAGLV
ncbi:MAG: EscU/YscU/HrcU family type III secretion system export apparatus switch protein [Kiloniellales bacterium]|nr:EscU/YscU/HrcU family type III secretion system export apparatus switch protein [Kiloniellales bacterium]